MSQTINTHRIQAENNCTLNDMNEVLFASLQKGWNIVSIPLFLIQFYLDE